MSAAVADDVLVLFGSCLGSVLVQSCIVGLACVPLVQASSGLLVTSVALCFGVNSSVLLSYLTSFFDVRYCRFVLGVFVFLLSLFS